MRLRTVVITEIIAPYRIPVFNALARQPAIDLHVIFLAETDPTQRQWLVYKDEIQFSSEVLPSWRRRVSKRNVLLNWGMDSALEQASPEAIICGGYNYIASWEALRWAERRDVRFLLWVESTARDFRKGYPWVESLKTRFLRRCDGFVVAGRSSAEYLLSYGISQETIFTAPNAVDTQFFRQASAIARANAPTYRTALGLPSRYFLFVGRLVPEKGIFDLLHAYASLDSQLRDQVGLVFVGDGPARSELERRGAALQGGLVHVAGFAQREQLATYYALADVFVFPTHTDPWGLVTNEAMTCGLPVVSSRAAGCAADLVEDHYNGRVVDARDVRQLASVLSELARDHELRLRMGQRSRERIDRHSPQACAAGMAAAALHCAEVPHA